MAPYSRGWGRDTQGLPVLLALRQLHHQPSTQSCRAPRPPSWRLWSIPNLDSQSLAASVWKTPARPGLGSPCVTGIGSQVRFSEALSLPGAPQVRMTRHGSQTVLMSPGGKNHCWLRSLWVRVLHTRKPLGPTVTCLQSVWTDRSPSQKSGSQETLLASM